MPRKLSIRDVHLDNRRVLVRVDYNVPIRDGRVVDNRKIVASLPTIQFALERGARSVVLISHLGKPQGRKVTDLSLEPVAQELSFLLDKPVIFVHDCVGAEASKACAHPEPGSVILLENLRFHPEEEGYGLDAEGKLIAPNERARHAFIHSLSHLADVFVNDAFKGEKHDQSASFYIDLPKRVAGLQIERELQMLETFAGTVEPVLLILGGRKLLKKEDELYKILGSLNSVIIGGAMSLAFLKAMNGMSIGDAIADELAVETANEFIDAAKKQGVPLLFPSDYVCGDKFDPNAKTQVFSTGSGIPQGWVPLDIGPNSAQQFAREIMQSRTVVWDGTMGVDEWPAFATGSRELLNAVVDVTDMHRAEGARSIVCGRETCAFVAREGQADKVTYLTVNNKTVLQYLAGKQPHSYNSWIMDEDQARIRVVVERDKDALNSGVVYDGQVQY